MRRRLFQVGLCLVLGAIVNVGVAWWCAGSASWTGNWSALGSDPAAPAPITWLWPERAIGEAAPNLRWTSIAFGARRIEVSRQDLIKSLAVTISEAEHLQRTTRAGWPMLALETRDQYPPRHAWKPRFLTENVWINSFEQGLCFTGPASRGHVVLPLVPRWIGFGVNTLFYAAAVWLLTAGLVGVRRTIRRRRGRCARCGYILHGVSKCPECGLVSGTSTVPKVNQ